MLEYVDVAQAREATGLRVAVNGQVPSPWSEAVKGTLRIANVPALVARKTRENGADFVAWTGVDNVPAVCYGVEPVRTTFSAIVGLVARLAAPDTVLPADPVARADIMGALELVAGEDGLGWNGRLAMIDASLTDGRGFSKPIGEFLARRYGYTPGALPAVRARITAQLASLHARLVAQHARGHAYLTGPSVSVLDVYLTTFLTPLFPVTDDVCPQLGPMVRAAFGCAAEAFGPLVSPELAAHRTLMFERHLEWPIPL